MFVQKTKRNKSKSFMFVQKAQRKRNTSKSWCLYKHEPAFVLIAFCFVLSSIIYAS